MSNFFSKLVPNIIGSFRGRNKWFHITAIALTAIIVLTGLDWVYFVYIQDAGFSKTLTPAVIIGGLVPIVLPLALIFAGIVLDKRRGTKYGWYGAALAQAAILGSLISSTYKAFTGRVQPNLTELLVDGSRNFNFGFWEHGIFWGWPSSHTTIAFAMSFCLIYLARKNTFVTVLALFYAFYIGLGISVHIHWFSEFVAGALIGSVIGATVGKSYTQK